MMATIGGGITQLVIEILLGQVHQLKMRRGQRDAGQAGRQSRAEILLVHLLFQRDGRAGINVVPRHIKVLHDY